MPLVESVAEALHVLQLPPGASQQEIRRAFKRQALLL